jgi:RNA polymerase sigma factor (sigma-70 family)
MEASAARRHAGVRPAPVGGRLLRLASDERLVAMVRAGSERAFETLFDRHHRAILSFCRHMLADPVEAEDAAQHTFMAAYRDLAGSDKAIQLKPWLYTIARNRCLTILRARRERPLEDVEELSTANLAADVERRQDLRDLLHDLAGLPEEQRAALVLSELGDVSHEQIAVVLGCRREKVKALVFQARSSLLASRKARAADCTEIREQLATLHGGALRRNTLRRHLKDCEGCRAFASDVREQRRNLAVVLPVLPTAGFKSGVLGAIGGSGGAGALAAVGGGAAGGGALAAKALVVVALAGGGTATGVATVGGSADQPAPAAGQPAPAGGPAAGGPGVGLGQSAPAAAGGQETADRARSGDTPIKRRVRKGGKDRGSAREAARGRGKAGGRGAPAEVPGPARGRDYRMRGGGRATKPQRDVHKAERKAEPQAPRKPAPAPSQPTTSPAPAAKPAPAPGAVAPAASAPVEAPGATVEDLAP